MKPKEIPVSGSDKPALVDADDYDWLSAYQWYAVQKNGQTHAATMIEGVQWLMEDLIVAKTKKTDHQDTERPEPFATVLDLLEEYSEGKVLSAISRVARFDSEDNEVSACCRAKSARLHLELKQLLDRMSEFEDLVDRKDPTPEA